MGTFIYEGGLKVDIEDRALNHLQLVISAEFRGDDGLQVHQSAVLDLRFLMPFVDERAHGAPLLCLSGDNARDRSQNGGDAETLSVPLLGSEQHPQAAFLRCIGVAPAARLDLDVCL